MKKYLFLSVIFIVILILSCTYSYLKGFEDKTASRFQGYKYAAEWGCYQGAIGACAFLEDEKDIEACHEDALNKCPQYAKAFYQFMRQPLKK